MRIIKNGLVLLAFVLMLGCSSVGGTRMSTGQVTVSIGQVILDSPEKAEALRKGHGVEHLHDFMVHYARRSRIPDDLTLEATIIELRLGWGKDHMATETVVGENGLEIKRFSSVRATSRGNQIERLAKVLAKDIIIKVREI